MVDMTTTKQRAAAKRNIKKAIKGARRKNDRASAEKNAHGSRKRRSQGCTKETKAPKIKVVSGCVSVDGGRFLQ
jgi:hypothetical protein